jgi:hypothetical protein
MQPTTEGYAGSRRVAYSFSSLLLLIVSVGTFVSSAGLDRTLVPAAVARGASSPVSDFHLVGRNEQSPVEG